MLLGSFSNPIIFLTWIIAILAALSVHEFSHALAGKYFGDKTAEREGRLTLNPLAHIDWMGLFSLVLVGFGWGKPVPFNPYNLKNPRWGSVGIAMAGPASNLIFAIVAAIAIRVLDSFGLLAGMNLLPVFLLQVLMINLVLMFFNLIPIHPLDGSKVVFALLDKPQYRRLHEFLIVRGPQILLGLIILNILTPIKILSYILIYPVFIVCDLLLSESCLLLFGSVF